MTTHKKGVMYVYKLDTGNQQLDHHHHHPSTPPPSTTITTTKNAISRTFGALLRRSKTYRENNHNQHHISIKEDTKEVVQESSRKSLPTIENGRKSVPTIEDSKKEDKIYM